MSCKKCGISQLAEWLLALQEEFCFMELILLLAPILISCAYDQTVFEKAVFSHWKVCEINIYGQQRAWTWRLLYSRMWWHLLTFREKHCLHFQGQRVIQAETPTRLHDVTSQMIVFFTVAAMRTLYVWTLFQLVKASV